jgi:ATP-dependent helicase/nuclease subunit A
MAPSASQLRIYSSSAGSGKTYTLAKEYLKCALRSNETFYFKHILAVTFTNKAASEMKQRILRYLHAFAYPERLPPAEQAQAQALLDQIIQEWNQQDNPSAPSEVETRRRAVRVFKSILHDYAQFAILTIDAFVQRIVSAFTEELALPFNFETSLEQELLLDTAVEQLLQKAYDQQYGQLTEILQTFALEKVDEGRSWHQLHAEIAQVAKVVLEDKNHALLQDLNRLQESDFQVIENQINEYLKNTKAEIQNLAQAAYQIMDEAGLAEDSFSQGSRGVMSFFREKRQGEKLMDSGNSYVQKFFDADNPARYKKTQIQSIKDSIDAIAPLLEDCYQQISAIKQSEEGKVILYENLRLNLKKMALLGQLQREVGAILTEKKEIHISEFNQKILNLVLKEPLPFVYERLGDRFNHLLIDEFQDTSVVQWHIFLPLLSNALSAGYFNLVVGDAKQSIYRFRGGEMDLIAHLHSSPNETIQEREKRMDFFEQKFIQNENVKDHYEALWKYVQGDSLQTNYRSAQEIVDFNNAFFKNIAESKDNQSIAPQLSRIYNENFVQNLPPNPRKGAHVQVNFLPGKKEEYTDTTQQYCAQLIAQVLDQGYVLSEIALLFRSNYRARQMANFLKNQGYAIVSADSLLLQFSEPINLVMAMMKVVRDPNNWLAKTEALYLFHRLVLQKIPDTQTNTDIKITVESENSQEFFRYLKKYNYILDGPLLQTLSLIELTESLMSRFGLFDRGKDTDFLFQLLDTVLDFSINTSAHLTDFLDYWEKNKHKLYITSPNQKEAINLLTIHKAKGLEYPVVIIPYCDWDTSADARRDTRWVEITTADVRKANLSELIVIDQEDARMLTSAQFRIKDDMLKTPFKEQFEEEEAKIFMESINMLYVALTRPTEQLHIISNEEKIGKKNVATLLKNYLYLLSENNTPESNAWVIAEGQTSHSKSARSNTKEQWLISGLISSEKSQQVRLRHSAERLYNIEDLEKRKNFGNVVHAAFAKIRIATDVERAIYELQKEGVILEKEKASLVAQLEQLLQLPELAELFSERVQVKNEREILLPDGSILRPDRVVRLPDGSIVILDYKTGEKTESHRHQIQRYMTIYRAMGHAQVRGALVYLQRREVLWVE